MAEAGSVVDEAGGLVIVADDDGSGTVVEAVSESLQAAANTATVTRTIHRPRARSVTSLPPGSGSTCIVPSVAPVESSVKEADQELDPGEVLTGDPRGLCLGLPGRARDFGCNDSAALCVVKV